MRSLDGAPAGAPSASGAVVAEGVEELAGLEVVGRALRDRAGRLDDSLLALDPRGVAEVLRQPDRAAHGRRVVAALRAEAAVRVAPQLANRAAARRREGL